MAERLPGRTPVSAHDNISNLAQWKDYVRDRFPWLEISGGSRLRGFDAEVNSLSIGASALATIRSSETEVHRTRQLAERADAGYVKLLWQLTGSMEIEQDKRRSVLASGEACVCDTARPYRVAVMENSQFAVLTLPYGALPGWEQISQKVCGSLLQDKVTSRVALSALLALSQTSTTVDNEGADDALRAVQWMLTASLRRAALREGNSEPSDGRLSKAQSYVLQHLGDPTLDADELASALHMSRRSLYMLFKEYRMTPGRMIHDLRLEFCHKALSDLSQQQRSITDIAFEYGFQDSASFSRLFKTQYGVSPSEFRRKTLGNASIGSGDSRDSSR